MSSEETLNQSTVGGNITDAVKKVLVINCAVNIPLAITSIIGNLLVLRAVWKTPTLRSPSVVLLCGLALSDLAVGAVVQPFFHFKGFNNTVFSRSILENFILEDLQFIGFLCVWNFSFYDHRR